jgi:hypothetical protein
MRNDSKPGYQSFYLTLSTRISNHGVPYSEPMLHLISKTLIQLRDILMAMSSLDVSDRMSAIEGSEQIMAIYKAYMEQEREYTRVPSLRRNNSLPNPASLSKVASLSKPLSTQKNKPIQAKGRRRYYRKSKKNKQVK